MAKRFSRTCKRTVATNEQKYKNEVTPHENINSDQQDKKAVILAARQ
ncbi:hypothetical protein [Marinifaba aquimaris]|nr:hypothetical protein [Marinifaba aquimaris]